jgi:hypothetical protein
VVVIWEQVEGTRWIVVHSLENRQDGSLVFMLTNAPPPYASPALRAAMTGATQASASGHCDRCEVLTPPPESSWQDHDRTWVLRKYRHAPWCPYSDETVDALHEACRPPGEPREYSEDESEEETRRVGEYLAALEASLRGGGGPYVTA